MLHLDTVHVYIYIFFSEWVVKCWETLPFPWEIIAYGTLSVFQDKSLSLMMKNAV